MEELLMSPWVVGSGLGVSCLFVALLRMYAQHVVKEVALLPGGRVRIDTHKLWGGTATATSPVGDLNSEPGRPGWLRVHRRGAKTSLLLDESETILDEDLLDSTLRGITMTRKQRRMRGQR
eukprot:PLAT5278.2.p2 GENE.PLAT5278.2~~PLAT5278.2.p2  ORF type:complete len:121 (+),score=45.81 PLAT5278.2:331-693(+)